MEGLRRWSRSLRKKKSELVTFLSLSISRAGTTTAFSRTATPPSFGAQVDAINGNQIHSKKFRGENVVTCIYIWTISSEPLPSCKWTVLIVNPFPLLLSSPTSTIFPLPPAPSPLTALARHHIQLVPIDHHSFNRLLPHHPPH